MMDSLKVTIIQSVLHWESPEENRQQFAEKIKEQSLNFGKTDLIVLPEMFTTGFSMNAKVLAENMSGKSLQWMMSMAKAYDTAITGSIIITENNTYYNRLLFVFPDGNYEYYDKRHTFTLAGEDKTFRAGNDKLIVNYQGWRICPLICYDLRFPVWARNTENYDLLIYVANWPKRRIVAWDALLKARSIENMSYCIGVNRLGEDGNGHEYNGHSAVYDVLGHQLTDIDSESECVINITLDKNHIDSTRDQLQFLNDRDNFNLN
jgi:omega-amidase